jgi:hyperosmotically inducible periplasmic protein
MSRKHSSLFAILAAFAALLIAVACAQSDAGITVKVKAKLASDSTVKATQINVDTRDKIVTLSGTVDSEAAKAQALALARGTEGVADVVDNLTLTAAQSADAGRSVGQVVDDASITAAVKSKLMTDSVVGALKIDVDTKDGIVSLNGPVKTQSEKDTALRIARETSGVKDVRDNLVVQSG